MGLLPDSHISSSPVLADASAALRSCESPGSPLNIGATRDQRTSRYTRKRSRSFDGDSKDESPLPKKQTIPSVIQDGSGTKSDEDRDALASPRSAALDGRQLCTLPSVTSLDTDDESDGFAEISKRPVIRGRRMRFSGSRSCDDIGTFKSKQNECETSAFCRFRKVGNFRDEIKESSTFLSKLIPIKGSRGVRGIQQRPRPLRPESPFKIDKQLGVVCMNVGGTKFFTTLRTLQREPDSMLCKLFSGKYKLSTLSSDLKAASMACFIDRSPEVFEYILDYLRNGPVFTMPPTTEKRRKLLVEGMYYSLDGLVRTLVKPLKKHFEHKFDGDCNGIFYHLGTLRSASWINPHVAGEVGITASEGLCKNLNSLSSDEEGEIEGPLAKMNFPLSLYCARLSQQFPKGPFRFFELSSCDAAHHEDGAWVQFDFGKRRVRMESYTLRYGDCYGLGGSWDWQGSNDGQNWTLLQRVCNDSHLNCEHPKFPKQFRVSLNPTALANRKRLRAIRRRALLCSHTFKVDNPNINFFRFLRIKKPVPFMPEADIESTAAKASAGYDQGCLHFWGLEIYGTLGEEAFTM